MAIELMESNISEKLFAQIDHNKIDLIFANSKYLDDEAIIDLIKALCSHSQEELNDLHHPRIFSLQKIVEVADSNMSRIRYVWYSLW